MSVMPSHRRNLLLQRVGTAEDDVPEDLPTKQAVRSKISPQKICAKAVVANFQLHSDN